MQCVEIYKLERRKADNKKYESNESIKVFYQVHCNYLSDWWHSVLSCSKRYFEQSGEKKEKRDKFVGKIRPKTE
jgi:hypothetical protein